MPGKAKMHMNYYTTAIKHVNMKILKIKCVQLCIMQTPDIMLQTKIYQMHKDTNI